MTELLLTITQALQLVALTPCFFVVAFLICSGRKDGSNIVPILYFLSLGCSFMIPLLSIFGEIGSSLWFRGSMLLGESLISAFSFLLVIQFLDGRIPRPVYWLILTIPLIGGTPFIYSALSANEVCLDGANCVPTESMRLLYMVFSAALVFLLLIVRFAKSSSRIAMDDIDRKHKYWLVISLILLNLVLAFLDLGQVAELISPANTLFTSTIIRIAFIYLVMTSIFRVFYDLFDVQIAAMTADKTPRNPEQDKLTVQKIKKLLEQDKVYREMGLSREEFARRVGVSEHQMSRLVNTYFNKNLNELINYHRINEAKDRLQTEDTQITVIAFEVGFNSIASFNRVFKEMVGRSPTEYRQVKPAQV